MNSKHDSWVYLKPDIETPFNEILGYFPQGFPVRDPIPMGGGNKPDGTVEPCWIMDLNRCCDDQVLALAYVALDPDLEITAEDAIAQIRTKGMMVAHKWVGQLEGGAECRARNEELTEFIAAHPNPTPAQMAEFYRMQEAKWVRGDAVPSPELFLRVEEV